ncbi:Prenyltransferase and squalene oxidase repeat-containing protein [Actinacidiphila yanglinensis]|uniref:Prenyltransferase and squalene oxidase repeat-containing protein n=1 Tax=Actinacidiphila yanglinensis TaxID=310779 RepID=A0A1H5SIL9_9ACTN|nr:prenyltransferase/squalene oxidase repeat-containing protein [Actinacidiphila yanglinensis]SEF50456.1 Prenyltransferase and squalene oxidase repeat-containing protein [Actinacidiphila yanglinensis]
MPLRRRATLLVAAAATVLLAAPAAGAAAPPAGLYGSADPTYDGVWRQSYTFLALHAAGLNPGASAVSWLTGQQCADGGFPSFRADTAQPCAEKAEDTNSTGIAVQALTALGGHQQAVAKATGWLKKVQNADGGWSYNAGGASDPDSTAIVIGTLQAASSDPAVASAKGRTPYQALRGFQFGCSAKAADRGSFGYPAGGKLAVNAKATADAVRGSQSAGFLIAPPAKDTAAQAPSCTGGKDIYAAMGPSASAFAGAAWLTAQLDAGGHHLTAVTPGAAKPTADYGTTADAVVALASGGQLAAAEQAYAWLAANSATWAHGSPAALAQLILAAHATGNDPHHAHGADLVTQLVALGPAPSKVPASGTNGSNGSAAPGTSAAGSSAASASHHSSSSAATVWIVVGVCLVAGIGVGLLLSARKRRQH